MKSTNSRMVYLGELDSYSLKAAFAIIPVDELKKAAQHLRENIDWYGRIENNGVKYDALMEVIRISDPKFETEFTPAI